VLDHLSETQKRAYILADNQLALNAGWDEELLRRELVALQEEDFNIGLIGFEDEELARLLAAQDATEGLTDEDAVQTFRRRRFPRSGICGFLAPTHYSLAMQRIEPTWLPDSTGIMKGVRSNLGRGGCLKE